MEMKAAICCRVSIADQNCGIQLAELRLCAAARGLAVEEEFVDTGASVIRWPRDGK
jgi:hypothetical protein